MVDLIFNYELTGIDDDNADFSYDDAFGVRRTINVPNASGHFIKVGGTASAGSLEQYIGQIIESTGFYKHKVLINDDTTLEGCSSEPLSVDDIVYVLEHLSVISDPVYESKYLVSSKLPNYIHVHSINLDYVNETNGSGLARICIDPYNNFVRESDFWSAYMQYWKDNS